MIRRGVQCLSSMNFAVPVRTLIVKPSKGKPIAANNHPAAQQAIREVVKGAASINTSNSHIEFEPTPSNFDDLIDTPIAQSEAPQQHKSPQQQHAKQQHNNNGNATHKSNNARTQHANNAAASQAFTVPAAAIAPAHASPTAYQGIAQEPFSKEASSVLLGDIDPADVEIKPDGTVYMPEIKYRRRLNLAFGPGAWAMKPVGSAVITEDLLSRTYQLFCLGRFVAEATGEQRLRQGMTQATAEEAAKSNALMRCCKDLGIASELWDPAFINVWRGTYASEVWCTNQRSNEKRLLWRKKNAPPFPYPWKENAAQQQN